MAEGPGHIACESGPLYAEQSRRKERNRFESREANAFLEKQKLEAERREKNGMWQGQDLKSSCSHTSPSPEAGGGGIPTLSYCSQIIPDKNGRNHNPLSLVASDDGEGGRQLGWVVWESSG